MRKLAFMAALGAAIFAVTPIAWADPSPGTIASLNGMPAADRAWTPRDLVQAAGVLRAMPSADLPRINAPSNVYFERLSDPETLAVCNDGSPIAQRMQLCLDAFQAQVTIFSAYFNAFQGDGSFADDCMRAGEGLLYGAGMMSLLMEEFIPTLDPNDPSYATRIGGAEQAKRGLAEMTSGLIIMLNERHLYSAPARARLAAVLARVYPQITASLTDSSRLQFERELRDLAQSDPSTDVRAALTTFR